MNKIKELLLVAKACRPSGRIDADTIRSDKIPPADKGTVRILSFNLRCASDPEGSIVNRSRLVSAIILGHLPDSLGVQEETPKWERLLCRALKGRYARVGEARDSNGPFSESNGIYYLKNKYRLVDSCTFWLSETPEVKYSVGFGSTCKRIATRAVLENKKTGERYTHINTHLDHVLESTRVEQCRVLLEEMKKFSSEGTVVCTGDFNDYPDSAVYAAMTRETDDAAVTAKVTDKGLTFHGYGKVTDESTGPIDFIFLTKGTEVKSYKIIRTKAPDMYPSDHYPVTADIVAAK